MSHSDAMKVDLRHLSEEKTRHGKIVLYARLGGKRIRLKHPPSSPEFLDEYRAAVQQLKAAAPAKEGAARPARQPFEPKTFGWLVERYFEECTDFKRMNVIGRKRRRKILEEIKEKHGPRPMVIPAEIISAGVAKRAETPGAANDWLKSLKALYTCSKSIGLIKVSPAAGISKIEQDTEGFYTWSLEDIAAYTSRHPSGTMAYLTVMVLLFTGLRRSDAARFGRQHCKGGKISFKTSKTGAELLARVPWPLTEAVDAMPVTTELTLLLSAHGKPFASGAAFGNWFRDRCAEADLPQCTAHGLRKAGATIAAENGAPEVELEAMYGWSNNRQSGTYTRAAQQLTLATSGFGRIADALMRAGILGSVRENEK